MAYWSQANQSEITLNNRLDAEYYNPKDLAELSNIKKLGGSTLGSICDIYNGRTPNEYSENGKTLVVRSGDLTAPLIYPTCGKLFLKTSEEYDIANLKKGDVLISSIGLGSIGKVSLVVESKGMATVSEVTILRNSSLPPEYLFAYLRTPFGQRQINREITGATGQQHLLKSKVCNVIIPPPTKSLVNKLKDLCTRALDSEKKAKKLYDQISREISLF